MPRSSYVRLWNELPVLANDPDMPLHVLEYATQAARVDPALGVLIFLSAPTLGEALARLARFQRLNFDRADEPLSELLVEGDFARVLVHHERGELEPPTGAVIDSVLRLLLLARMATGKPVAR